MTTDREDLENMTLPHPSKRAGGYGEPSAEPTHSASERILGTVFGNTIVGQGAVGIGDGPSAHTMRQAPQPSGAAEMLRGAVAYRADENAKDALEKAAQAARWADEARTHASVAQAAANSANDAVISHEHPPAAPLPAGESLADRLTSRVFLFSVFTGVAGLGAGLSGAMDWPDVMNKLLLAGGIFSGVEGVRDTARALGKGQQQTSIRSKG